MRPNMSVEQAVCKLRLHPSAHFKRSALWATYVI